MDLLTRIADGVGDVVLFAVTPPRRSTEEQRVEEIAAATVARLAPLDLDGLVVYDIDDESARNPEERPFPYLPTRDPGEYVDRHLTGWTRPTVVYRAVGKYAGDELGTWLAEQDPARRMTVLVGASTGEVATATTLPQAQALRAEVAPDLLVGGVAIPERHARRGDEHLRMLAKQEVGVRFFVTQVVYDVDAAKDLVSDYHYACRERGVRAVPVVFTFSVCGSLRTLEFLEWLGVEVPRWIRNELVHAEDTLEESFDHALTAATELVAFCRRLGVPVGVNVESVSIRRVEIEASVRLAARLAEVVRAT